jgi:hypothetical protein
MVIPAYDGLSKVTVAPQQRTHYSPVLLRFSSMSVFGAFFLFFWKGADYSHKSFVYLDWIIYLIALQLLLSWWLTLVPGEDTGLEGMTEWREGCGSLEGVPVGSSQNGLVLLHIGKGDIHGVWVRQEEWVMSVWSRVKKRSLLVSPHRSPAVRPPFRGRSF